MLGKKLEETRAAIISAASDTQRTMAVIGAVAVAALLLSVLALLLRRKPA